MGSRKKYNKSTQSETEDKIDYIYKIYKNHYQEEHYERRIL